MATPARNQAEIIDLTNGRQSLSQNLEIIDLTGDNYDLHTGKPKARPSSPRNSWPVDSELGVRANEIDGYSESDIDLCFYCARCQCVAKETAVLRRCGCVSQSLSIVWTRI